MCAKRKIFLPKLDANNSKIVNKEIHKNTHFL